MKTFFAITTATVIGTALISSAAFAAPTITDHTYLPNQAQASTATSHAMDALAYMGTVSVAQPNSFGVYHGSQKAR